MNNNNQPELFGKYQKDTFFSGANTSSWQEFSLKNTSLEYLEDVVLPSLTKQERAVIENFMGFYSEGKKIPLAKIAKKINLPKSKSVYKLYSETFEKIKHKMCLHFDKQELKNALKHC